MATIPSDHLSRSISVSPSCVLAVLSLWELEIICKSPDGLTMAGCLVEQWRGKTGNERVKASKEILGKYFSSWVAVFGVSFSCFQREKRFHTFLDICFGYHGIDRTNEDWLSIARRMSSLCFELPRISLFVSPPASFLTHSCPVISSPFSHSPRCDQPIQHNSDGSRTGRGPNP